ncbi:MAG: phosphatidylglycerophosphatase A [Syntrophus sp. (in: bacteria)]|nr:phosphatidylglycerophosphatase A [Syntrophus sp. (in: bacteria)]
MGIQKAFNSSLQCITTCCYVGYLPGAPGTYASALGCVLIYLFPLIFGNIFFTIGLVLFSVFSVNLYRYDGKDPGYIVIDELAGICVTMAGQKITLTATAIGFVLFRFFDIVKPFPIKHAERLRGGYGVVADDVVAGIFANVALIILGRIL